MKVILQMFAIILKRIEKVNLLYCFKINPRKKVDVNFLSISSHCSIFEIRNNGITRYIHLHICKIAGLKDVCFKVFYIKRITI